MNAFQPARPGTPQRFESWRCRKNGETFALEVVLSLASSCARKRTVIPSNSAVPFMFIVTPDGMTRG
ncbi:MAG: hypothetical protein WD766_10515 [Gemmatimonadota bacterium]